MKEFLQDFPYLYDVDATDFVRFVGGENVARQTVYEEIGDPESFVEIVGPGAQGGDKGIREATPLPTELVRLLVAV